MSGFKNDPKAKRYYWLQLKTDFFDQKEIKLLRKIAGGDTFTIIYLKMLLASLKDDGKLYFEAIGDNFSEEIALLLDEDTENVSITLKFLESKGLIEVIESDEYFLNKVPEMVGSESYSAERMRRLRAKQASQSDGVMSHCDSDVTKRRDREELDIEIDNKNISTNQDSKKRFESIWKLYPNKKGKDKAFRAYCKAIKEKVSDEIIIDGIDRYKKEIQIKQTEKQYIAHGSTWFAQKRWQDEYLTQSFDSVETNSSYSNMDEINALGWDD